VGLLQSMAILPKKYADQSVILE